MILIRKKDKKKQRKEWNNQIKKESEYLEEKEYKYLRMLEASNLMETKKKENIRK